ncbi:hypothetical protein R75461_07858 [Paraburkholderia nemoris]|uniref:hypothetical protein n=1 Tax=Paraburkholderia nemoris TaxID=2793076 RepID=UPI00190E1E58|nr:MULTISPECIES: hypothetical protein [Paraburkholderia]MBK3786866.1 hypothetical protein [Paraburkholderia aspalathi]CAE6858601.1 hypothetical protein R75461_07858 [Paraburkholderia nemoris]
MAKGEQRLVITPAKVLACMTPDTTYTLVQIARLIGIGPPEAQRMLSACVAKGSVKELRDGKRAAYRLRTDEDIRHERERAERSNTLPQGVLQGYDAEHRRFREMCMASRRPLSGRANGKDDSEPDE